MAYQLSLIDNLVAAGKDEFTFGEAMEALGISTTATANVLHRLTENGLVDKLARGRYAIRTLGSLGTSAVTDDLGLAVASAFAGTKHRIAYLSALNELGLLAHPVRTVFVACTKQVRLPRISRRPLRVSVERERTIHLEAEQVGRSWMSTPERALFECALRVDLAGHVERLAEALARAAPDVDRSRIRALAKAFGPRGLAAERRLDSLARALNLPLHLEPHLKHGQPIVRLDPRDDRVEWIDQEARVSWPLTLGELDAAVRN
jgi:predicted transcriptional regulator of viral defense system